MKKCSLLLVVLFLLCGSLNLPVYAEETTASDEKVLFFADFENSETPAESGISTTDWRGRAPSNFEMKVVDGKLNVKRDKISKNGATTHAFEFLSEEVLASVGILKVEYDVGVIANNPAAKDTAMAPGYWVGVEACKSSDNDMFYYSFELYGTQGQKIFSDVRCNENTTEFYGFTRSRSATKTDVKLLDTTDGAKNKEVHVELIFDFDKRVVDYSINGTPMNDPVSLPADDSGMALEFFGHDYEVTIDNLKATQLSTRGELRYEGYQTSAVYGANAEEGIPGKYNIRFVAFGSDMTADKIGFRVKAVNFEGKEWDCSSSTVYTSILANSSDGRELKKVEASEYHAAYLSALTIKGVPANTEVVFEVTPYTVTADGTIVYSTGYRVAVAADGSAIQTEIGG